jgi:GDPmannose 4,6-dehydratase
MSGKKVALVTGITGQDGSYLAEFLINKGYVVHGLVRKSSHFTTERLQTLLGGNFDQSEIPLFLHYGDLLDFPRIFELIKQIEPNEIYNLAAQSHVKVSFELPSYSCEVDAQGVVNLLEAIRILAIECRLYQASSSEMFGDEAAPQNENTRLNPRSPYAAAKSFSHNLIKVYRESYDIFAVGGILFNHESPRRHESFVTRKITKGVAEIVCGKKQNLILGNLDARRDWGYAPEYIEAMWLMLQQENPIDLVIATGTNYSVRQFVDYAFQEVGLEWEKYVDYSANFERPLEVPNLQGDARLAKKLIGWQAKVLVPDLVKIMVGEDIRLISN